MQAVAVKRVVILTGDADLRMWKSKAAQEGLSLTEIGRRLFGLWVVGSVDVQGVPTLQGDEPIDHHATLKEVDPA